MIHHNIQTVANELNAIAEGIEAGQVWVHARRFGAIAVGTVILDRQQEPMKKVSLTKVVDAQGKRHTYRQLDVVDMVSRVEGR